MSAPFSQRQGIRTVENFGPFWRPGGYAGQRRGCSAESGPDTWQYFVANLHDKCEFVRSAGILVRIGALHNSAPQGCGCRAQVLRSSGCMSIAVCMLSIPGEHCTVLLPDATCANGASGHLN